MKCHTIVSSWFLWNIEFRVCYTGDKLFSSSFSVVFFPVSVRILNCRSFSVFTFSSVTVSKDFSGTLTKVSSFMHLSFQNKKECFQCIQLQVYNADVRYQTHHNKPEWWCVQCTMVVTRGQYPKIKCSASCLHLSHPP